MNDIEFNKKLNELLNQKWQVVLRNRVLIDRTKVNFGTDKDLNKIYKLLKKQQTH